MLGGILQVTSFQTKKALDLLTEGFLYRPWILGLSPLTDLIPLVDTF